MYKGTLLPRIALRLHPESERIFASLCVLPSADELATLQHSVATYAEKVRNSLYINEFLDMDLVDKITETLALLLALYADFSIQEQKLIIGAAHYFVQQNDAEPDTMSVLGFDDDVEVLNYVLEQIGQPQLKVTI